MYKKGKTQRGITLIALVITIIVMLILVGVTISMTVNGGLFEKAGEAVSDTKDALRDEKELAKGKIKVGDIWYNSIDEVIHGKASYTLEELGLEIGDVVDLEANNVLTVVEGTHTSYYTKTGAADYVYKPEEEFEGNVEIDQSFTTEEMGEITWQVLREENGNIVLIGSPSSKTLKFNLMYGFVYGEEELHSLCQDLFKYTDKDGNVYKANSFAENDLFGLVGRESISDYGIVTSGEPLWGFCEETGFEDVSVPMEVNGTVEMVTFTSPEGIPDDLIYNYYIYYGYNDVSNLLVSSSLGSYWIASRSARK